MMFAYRTPPTHSLTHSPICNAVLRRTVAGLGMLLMLLLFSPDSAQMQVGDAPAHLTQHADEQVAELVESTNPAFRTDGMQLLIKLSDEVNEASSDRLRRDIRLALAQQT